MAAPAAEPWRATVGSSPRMRLLSAVAAVAVLAAAVLAIPAVRYLRQTPPPETRTEIVTPATDDPASFGLSPDGRQIAFVASGDGGSRLWLRDEVYVRPFVPPGEAGTALRLRSGQAAGAAGGQWQVSTAGGIMPAWRPDGTELYYLDPAGAMMAAPITVTGATLAPGAPVVLFPTRIVGGGVDNQLGRQYDVAPDGRFLINTLLDDAAAPITLLMNWQPEVKK